MNVENEKSNFPKFPDTVVLNQYSFYFGIFDFPGQYDFRMKINI